MTILIIDDVDDVITVLRILLQRQLPNERVIAFSSGNEAINFISSNKDLIYTLVLCDIRMPIMSGIEVATEIKGINREIPVLLMTAHDTPNLIKEIKALGLSVISKSSGLGYIAKEVAQNYSRSNVGS